MVFGCAGCGVVVVLRDGVVVGIIGVVVGVRGVVVADVVGGIAITDVTVVDVCVLFISLLAVVLVLVCVDPGVDDGITVIVVGGCVTVYVGVRTLY